MKPRGSQYNSLGYGKKNTRLFFFLPKRCRKIELYFMEYTNVFHTLSWVCTSDVRIPNQIGKGILQKEWEFYNEGVDGVVPTLLFTFNLSQVTQYLASGFLYHIISFNNISSYQVTWSLKGLLPKTRTNIN